MIEALLQADRLLNVDMVEQADAIYRRVAEQDPQNAIAVVGMARCELARGDDHAAYRMAERALVIDPQNDMARRMEARLREVLVTRGEPPVGADVPAVEKPATAPQAAGRPAPDGGPPAAASPTPVAASSATGRSLIDRLLGR